jgi:hypothetical protein
MSNPSEPTDGEPSLASSDLFAAFDAKIRWCEEKAKECYECREDDCSDIGKYYDAAKVEITRFRNELFPRIEDDNHKRDPLATVKCPKCKIVIGECWANSHCPGCGHFITANVRSEPARPQDTEI